MAVADGEKKVIELNVVKEEENNERDQPVPLKRKRGRPPKVVKVDKNGESERPVLQKRKRGRPPKSQGTNMVSLPGSKRKHFEAVEVKRAIESGNVSGRRRKKVKGRRGRPPKIKGLGVNRKVNRREEAAAIANGFMGVGDHIKYKGGGREKRLQADRDNSGKSESVSVSGMKEFVEGKEVGRREQQQSVRDQIVAMVKKAGWTIEYRKRQSRDYMDAVYVDPTGKTYWSVTLAYRKLKERIEDGRAGDREISAFSPIAEESLCALFRVRKEEKEQVKGKKGAKKITKGITKKETSLVKGLESRPNKGKRRTLLARRPGEGSNGQAYELYEGKRNLLSWMIDLNTVQIGEKVKYKRGKSRRVLLEGKITRDGICCDCCSKIYTFLDFESHAGSDVGEPFKNIYLGSGDSLLQCLVDSWTKQLETDHIGFVSVDVNSGDPNDDTCNICGDGGDLICCDGCPSTFHQSCLCSKVPSGDWFCAYCSCKFCGMAEGTSTTSDGSHYSTVAELFTCRSCEEKFHAPCIEREDSEDIDYTSFCGKQCKKIFERLQVLLGVRHELEGEYSYTVLQRRDVCCGPSLNSLEIENNSKLAVAFAVMDECFEPIIDERSKTHMIHNVVYSCGSNFRRLNYGGFYTIILEKGDELISAASIRIHGDQLAEMPFIGTRFIHRRQGMCSRLLKAIETVLSSLNVKKLVIPAISELNETWTKVFGFMPLEESKKLEMKYMSIIVFPGIDLLQKPILGDHVPEEEMDVADISAAMENGQQDMQEVIQELGYIPASHTRISSLEIRIEIPNGCAYVGTSANPPERSLNDSLDVERGEVNDADICVCCDDASGTKIQDQNKGASLEPPPDVPFDPSNDTSCIKSGVSNVGESSRAEDCADPLTSETPGDKTHEPEKLQSVDGTESLPNDALDGTQELEKLQSADGTESLPNDALDGTHEPEKPQSADGTESLPNEALDETHKPEKPQSAYGTESLPNDALAVTTNGGHPEN